MTWSILDTSGSFRTLFCAHPLQSRYTLFPFEFSAVGIFSIKWFELTDDCIELNFFFRRYIREKKHNTQENEIKKILIL